MCLPFGIREPIILSLLAILVALPVAVQSQAVLGQADDFEDGTTKNWSTGPTSPPVNISSGGPLGAGDNYLQLTSDASGPGGKLTTYNRSQWLGNYTAAGVTSVQMDLKSLAGGALDVRIAFKTGTANTDPGYASTTAFSLANDGFWHQATFDLSAMSAVGSPGVSLATLLNGPAEMRILHSAAANTVHGDNISAQLGIDNITAVPEPRAAPIMGGLFLIVFAACRHLTAAMRGAGSKRVGTRPGAAG